MFSQTNDWYSVAKLGALSLMSSTETRTTAVPTFDGSTDTNKHLSRTSVSIKTQKMSSMKLTAFSGNDGDVVLTDGFSVQRSGDSDHAWSTVNSKVMLCIRPPVYRKPADKTGSQVKEGPVKQAVLRFYLVVTWHFAILIFVWLAGGAGICTQVHTLKKSLQFYLYSNKCCLTALYKVTLHN